MGQTYLVTGAMGFIGSCLTHKLVSLQKNVHIISTQENPNWRLKDVKNKLKIHQIDLLDKSLPALVGKIKPAYVYHLATYGSLPQEDNIEQMIRTNILGTANLIRGANTKQLRLFINTSSSAEYSIQNRPYKETDRVSPINDYGVSKAAQTLFCIKEAKRNNIPIITFRLFSVYGYYEHKTRLIPDVILNALKNEDIPLSNKLYVRDFVFVEDVIDAYLRACQNIPSSGSIFNIGAGKQYSIEDVVNLILKLTKSKSKPNWGKIEKQERQIEPKMWRANIDKARKTLGWSPNHSIEEGLKKTIKWFQNNQRLYA